MMTTTQVIVRMTVEAPDGTMHVAEYPISPEENAVKIWEVAHSRSDSQLPNPSEIGVQMWASALRFRRAENELRSKIGLDPLPLPSDGAASDGDGDAA